MFKDLNEREMEKCVAIKMFVEGFLKRGQAAAALNLSERQVTRLAAKFKEKGPEGMKKKELKRECRFSDAQKDEIFNLIDTHYWDYGPTLIAEKLGERHNIKISKETIRRFMIQTNRWNV